MRTPPPAEIGQQLSNARTVIEHNLAGTLQGIHLFGSAVDKGLKPHSDIDLLVTVAEPLAPPIRRSLMNELLTISAWPGTNAACRALEVTVVVRDELVPWRYPPRRELQFGEWLREELEAGCIPPPALDPDLAILLTKARQRSSCLMGVPASELFDPVPKEDFTRALVDTTAQWNEESDWHGDELTVVLALARIWFSMSTGRITSKEIAATWVLERLPGKYQSVLKSAQTAYLGGTPDGLADRPEQVSAFVRYAKERIENMYQPTLRTDEKM